MPYIFAILDYVGKFVRVSFHDFSDVFITIKRHIYWNENFQEFWLVKFAKITTCTVFCRSLLSDRPFISVAFWEFLRWKISLLINVFLLNIGAIDYWYGSLSQIILGKKYFVCVQTHFKCIMTSRRENTITTQYLVLPMWATGYDNETSTTDRSCLDPDIYKDDRLIEGFHMKAKCEIWMIIRVKDHSNDGVLARVYAN